MLYLYTCQSSTQRHLAWNVIFRTWLLDVKERSTPPSTEASHGNRAIIHIAPSGCYLLKSEILWWRSFFLFIVRRLNFTFWRIPCWKSIYIYIRILYNYNIYIYYIYQLLDIYIYNIYVEIQTSTYLQNTIASLTFQQPFVHPVLDHLLEIQRPTGWPGDTWSNLHLFGRLRLETGDFKWKERMTSWWFQPVKLDHFPK